MKYNPYRHNRHSIRLHGYNYVTAGAYFVTVCLNQRIPRGQQLQPRGQQLQPRGQQLQPRGQQLQPQEGQPRGVAPTAELGFGFPTFGLVENCVMVLNDSGKMVQQIWNEMPKYYSGIELGEFIVMPDHIHGIIKINDPPVGATPRGCPIVERGCPIVERGCPIIERNRPISLPYLMDCFKTMTTTKYINGVKTSKWKPFCKKLWQRNYWEHIIRSDEEYARIAEYIRNNPVLWGKITPTSHDN